MSVGRCFLISQFLCSSYSFSYISVFSNISSSVSSSFLQCSSTFSSKRYSVSSHCIEHQFIFVRSPHSFLRLKTGTSVSYSSRISEFFAPSLHFFIIFPRVVASTARSFSLVLSAFLSRHTSERVDTCIGDNADIFIPH